jgi:phosphoglycolate phosphatase-like HAD superfamily hydrolase
VSGASAETDPLPSWNDGPAKQSIVDFVTKVTTEGAPEFVKPEDRIATFDNDGTLWIEQPMYNQFVFAVDEVKAQANEHPEWKDKEPFKSVLAGDMKAVAAMGEKGMLEIVAATHSGMTTDQFDDTVKQWLETAKHPRFKVLYTDLVYQPMLELLSYLRANGFQTFIVSGGGVEFMRPWVERVYGIPPEQVVGSASGTTYSYDADGKPILTKDPKLLLNDNDAGKPEGIHLMIGRRPIAAFGNSTGDQQMLEYTGAGDGLRLKMLVLHDDAKREYAYGPAEGLPDTRVGTFSQDLYDEAKKDGWLVISMKNDWKKIFAFEESD